MNGIPLNVVVEYYASLVSALTAVFLGTLVHFRKSGKVSSLVKKSVRLLDLIIYMSLVRLVNSDAFRDELAQIYVAVHLDLGSFEDLERAVRRSLNANKSYLKSLNGAFALRKKIVSTYRVFREKLLEAIMVSGLSLTVGVVYAGLLGVGFVSPLNPFTYLLIGVLTGLSLIGTYLLVVLTKSYVELSRLKDSVLNLYRKTKAEIRSEYQGKT